MKPRGWLEDFALGALTEMNRRIVILGFMGCGKTTVARSLSRQLGCEMIDLDSYITEQAGRTPAEIIKADGEPAFRLMETQALADLLKQDAPRIIALGGGAWTVAANRALVSVHRCLSVWLDVPFAVCWQRITAKGKASRPLARNKIAARKLYDSRREAYKLAELRLGVDSAKTAVDSLMKVLTKSNQIQSTNEAN